MGIYWSRQMVAKLTRLWATKLSTRLIAKEMGLTKGMVIGKAHRLKLPARRSGPAKRRVKKQEVRAVKKLLRRRLPPQRSLPKEVLPPDNAVRVTLLERKLDQCAFPIEDKFCGAPVVYKIDAYGVRVLTSWCEYHFNIVHEARRNAKKEKGQHAVF